MHHKRPTFQVEQAVIPRDRAARKSTGTMNVTLKLPDETVREARHLAIDENTSLSGLVAQLLEERLKQRASKPQQSLAESLMLPDAPDWFYEKELPLPDRSESKHRTFSFEHDAP
jgi:N-acetylglutamate synthase-like GNAT family acetyltransferase